MNQATIITSAAIIRSAERDLRIARYMVRGLMLLTEELVPDEDVVDALAAMNRKALNHLDGAVATLTALKQAGGAQ